MGSEKRIDQRNTDCFEASKKKERKRGRKYEEKQK